MSSTAEELASQAEQLQDAVAFFKLNGKSPEAGWQLVYDRRKSGQKPHALAADLAAKPATDASKGVRLDLGNPGAEKADRRDTEFEKF
jgi:methyl-accepting chemotaxis protein